MSFSAMQAGTVAANRLSAGDEALDFPFSALHGQADLSTALLLAAVDPRLGGVLIVGPRGTAKSTSARALAALLPRTDGGGAFVNLPLGSSEEQLVGSLDLEAALQHGQLGFRPGLLARADGGVLYIDEINLLADNLIDLLLDVSASGINRIERDGLSHQHRAAFTLIGTMNPEEGELRPQLLDRFGLYVALSQPLDPATRETIVRRRLAFDADPAAFLAAQADAQQALRQRIAHARQQLAAIPFDDHSHAAVAARCAAAGVEGVRADLVMLRAARAHAALAGRQQLSTVDLDAVSELVLAHRRPPGAAETAPTAANQSPQATPAATPPAGTPPDSSLNPSPAQSAEHTPAPDPSTAASSASAPQAAAAPPPTAPVDSADPSAGPDSGAAGDWGALPAPAVAISPLKPLRSLRNPTTRTSGEAPKKP